MKKRALNVPMDVIDTVFFACKLVTVAKCTPMLPIKKDVDSILHHKNLFCLRVF